MANHNLPTQSSTYTNFVTELDGRLDDLAVGLDPARTTMTNLPTNSVGWSSGSNKWQRWTGSAWTDLATTYSISISGNSTTATTLQTARTINGVSFNGSANINVPTQNSITFSDSGGAAAGTTFNGSAARTISFATVGAPSTTGSGATGTWGISINGNASTVTNGVYTTGDQTIAGNKNFTGRITQAATVVAASNIDCSLGNYFTKTVSAATTFTVSNVPSGVYGLILKVTFTGGSITWFNNIKWPAAEAPILSTNKINMFLFITEDSGTSWIASSLLDYSV